MKRDKNIIINMIPDFTSNNTDDDSDEYVEVGIDMFSDEEEDDGSQEINPLYDPSLNVRFFENSTNNESARKMISFDTDEIDNKIYDIILEITEGVTVDIENKESDPFTEINTIFGKVLNNIDRFKEIECSFMLSSIFIQFSDVINVKGEDVFKRLLPKYQTMIKDELKERIGEKMYKFYEKRMIDAKKEGGEPKINDHGDVIIKRILF